MTDEQILLAVKIARTLGEGKETYGCPKSNWEIGKPYFIRTVTYHLTGKLIDVTEHELWLEDAAWIADDGRFAQAVEKGEFSEIEPYPSGVRVAVGRGSLIDAVRINTVPRSQK